MAVARMSSAYLITLNATTNTPYRTYPGIDFPHPLGRWTSLPILRHPVGRLKHHPPQQDILPPGRHCRNICSPQPLSLDLLLRLR